MFFFFQAEDGIRDAQESRGLGDVYKRQALVYNSAALNVPKNVMQFIFGVLLFTMAGGNYNVLTCIMAASGLSIGLGAIYLFNDLTDVKEDKNNERYMEI